MNEFDEKAVYEKFQKFPFFRAWQEGKLSRRLFRENMGAFKDDFSGEGISPEEYKWVFDRELAK